MQLSKGMNIRIFIIGCFFFFHASLVDAHVPNIVPDLIQSDVIHIEDPTLSQAYYGEMNDFPHTFVFSSVEPFHFFAQILLPDISSSKNNVSGIIIKLPEKRGRVTEIGRLEYRNATWETEYEPFGGDTYRNGPVFEKDLEPGRYRIEVHTPENLDKYVLVVGTREEMSIGYFETVRRLMEVKAFFGKSKLRIIESPYVYVPIIVISICMYVGWYYRRRFKKVDVENVILK